MAMTLVTGLKMTSTSVVAMGLVWGSSGAKEVPTFALSFSSHLLDLLQRWSQRLHIFLGLVFALLRIQATYIDFKEESSNLLFVEVEAHNKG